MADTCNSAVSCAILARMFRRRRVTFHDRRYVVDRGVFDPVRHLSGIAFAKHLAEFVPAGGRILDLGTGCGLLAGVAAETAGSVVATDISPAATACAARNLEGTGVDVRTGDLFAPVAGERFDLVVTNPPYEVAEIGDVTLGSPDFLRRLAESVADHTNRLVLAFPADESHVLERAGLDVDLWHAVPTRGETLGIFFGTA